MDFSKVDAALVRLNLWIAERMVEEAFTEAADIAAMNALPKRAEGGE